MRIDHRKMLAEYDQTDRIRYYPQCADLFMVGEDYKVNEITVYTKHEADPLADYILVKAYDDRFLLIVVHTEDENLVKECMDDADAVWGDFSEVELRTAYPSVVEMERIRGHYALETPDYPPNPVYYLYSADQLSKRQRQENVCVSQWKETDKAEIARAVEAGRLDGESMNADMFVPCEVYQAVEWHILRVNGELAGYLRAECGYANIYDIGWLYVEPRFRGKGYAVDLVLAFSRDMFSRGNIPHYGYAISPASARVAEKCGFICDQPLPICHRLIQGSMTPKA